MSEFADYNSPEAREQRRQQTIALRRAAFAPVREELARRGIECPMASDLAKFAPLNDEIVEILLAMVDDMARIEPVVAEMMVRALALAANKFDGTILERVICDANWLRALSSRWPIRCFLLNRGMFRPML